MSISTSFYGVTKAAAPAALYRLQNAAGMEVEITNYGATVVAIKVPDRSGKIEDVTLGADTLKGWEENHAFFGAIVGRFGNRIAQGRFTLDGTAYQIPINNEPNALHGGEVGFHQRLWTTEATTEDENGRTILQLSYTSPAGEQGFPGTLTAKVTYTLTPENELEIDYLLTTDAPTVANLTSHLYFNLAGEGAGTILDHEIQIDADRFVLTDATQIPTGELPKVAGTPMDLRQLTAIGARIDEDFPALLGAGGYDYTYVLEGSGFRKVAEAHDAPSGRTLEVLTTEPGVQFYSGNSLADEPGKNGHVYPRRSGFCLETQHFPDSPNQPDFPSTVLRPGETFTSKTVYRFSVR